MSGILYRDFLIIKKKYANVKTAVLLTVGVIGSIILGFYLSSILGLMLPLITGGIVVSIFSEDDKDNWNKAVKTLPVSNLEIVGARYAIVEFMIVVTACIGALFNVLAALMHSEDFMAIYYIFPLVGIVMATISSLFTLPFCYKYGVQGANSTSIAILFIIGAGVAYIRKGQGLNVIKNIENIPFLWLVIGLVLFIFALLILSIYISVKVFEKENVK
ncbi:ABC-2 transporter permease [Butyrivibrio sp. M55]|uniref:ABC-2 transporter permease n=1 Tax=Butyrivibrio sp. M55 TaxID=1855323 RepID=UPI0008E59D08|nr:ABC-2 transporter permease [Butyrivibrio sp. M55]SFU95319.1 ABC-2 family transporter protein [Butyrivibrio sp. M55]